MSIQNSSSNQRIVLNGAQKSNIGPVGNGPLRMFEDGVVGGRVPTDLLGL